MPIRAKVQIANLGECESRVAIWNPKRSTVIGTVRQTRRVDRIGPGRRPVAQQVPLRAILGTAGRMELPSLEEGFDELHYVRIDETDGFVVEEWRDEAR